MVSLQRGRVAPRASSSARCDVRHPARPFRYERCPAITLPLSTMLITRKAFLAAHTRTSRDDRGASRRGVRDVQPDRASLTHGKGHQSPLMAGRVTASAGAHSRPPAEAGIQGRAAIKEWQC